MCLICLDRKGSFPMAIGVQLPCGGFLSTVLNHCVGLHCETYVHSAVPPSYRWRVEGATCCCTMLLHMIFVYLVNERLLASGAKTQS